MWRLPKLVQLLIVIFSLGACMQAEKVSLDSSGLEGLLLNGITFNANATAGGGNGGTTLPVALTMTASTPAPLASQDLLLGRNGISITMSETLDSSITPVVHLYIVRSGTAYELTGLNETVSVTGNSITVDPHLHVWPGIVRIRVVLEKTSVRTADGRSPASDISLEFTTADTNGLYRAPIPLTRTYTNSGGGTPYYSEPASGMYWMPCLQGRSGADCSSGVVQLFTFEQAQAACGALNAGSGYGGLKGWRVPTVTELETLPDYGRVNPAISPTFPATWSLPHWTSSSRGADDAFAWTVDFRAGEVLLKNKAETFPVRCVLDQRGFYTDSVSSGFTRYTDEFGSRYGTDGYSSLPKFDMCAYGWTVGGIACVGSGSELAAQATIRTACQAREPVFFQTQLASVNDMKYIMRRFNPSGMAPGLASGGSAIYWTDTRLVGNPSLGFAVNIATGEIFLVDVNTFYMGRCIVVAPIILT